MPDAAYATQLIQDYGYIVIILGTFLEGETVVLLAGFLAHQGYLSLPLVALSAFTGSCASDQLMFFLARYKGTALLRRFPRLQKGVLNMATSLRGRETLLILSFRFFYGLRNITPIFLGISGVRPRRFIPLNIIGALIWAGIFSGLGYSSGKLLSGLLGKLHTYEPYIVGGIAVAGAVLWFVRKRARRGKD